MKLFQIAFLLVALVSAGASAQEARYTLVVPYGDLNLRSDAGQKAFNSRLERAVRSVCREQDGSVVPGHRFAVQECLTQTQAEVAKLRDRAVAGQSSPQALASR